MTRGGPIRVATIPHERSPTSDAVLPPDAVRRGAAGDPVAWLDVAHLEAHADEIDVLHLHSGDAHVAAVAVQCWAETVRRLGLPLVVTVHRVPPAGRAPGPPPRPATRPTWRRCSRRRRWC